MGGVVSTGENNDEMVDKLKEADYITTPIIEKVFRLVDRADYVTIEDKKVSYRDTAWKRGNLHLSAPCIYAQAMEGLQIGEGMSFLNIGSGTGYLSTIAGLLMGPKSTSHGIELHSDVIEYAYERLDWFRSHSGALDVLEFCEPTFIQGNAFCLPDDRFLYDRVYCGAACHDTHEKFMKELLKVGGILVMPINDKLLKVTRTSETEWKTEDLLPVTFSQLVIPDPTHPPATLEIPPPLLTPLQEMCKREIRRRLLNLVEQENPELKKSFNHEVQCTRNSRSEYSGVRKLFHEIGSDYEENSDSDNPDSHHSQYDSHRQVVNQILEMRRTLVAGRSLAHFDHAASIRRMNCRSNKQSTEEAEGNAEALDESGARQLDVEMAEVDVVHTSELTEKEKPTEESDQGLEDSLSEEECNLSSNDAGCLAQEKEEATSSHTEKTIPSIITEEPTTSSDKPETEKLLEQKTDINANSADEIPDLKSYGEEEEEEDSLSSHSTSSNSSHKRSRDAEYAKDLMELEEPKKREKFDSGVGDELEGDAATTPDESSEVDRDSDSDSNDSDYNMRIPAFKVFGLLGHAPCRERKSCSCPGCSRRRHRHSARVKDGDQSETKNEEEEKVPKESPVDKYSALMRTKIDLLPLPHPMKVFINNNREM